MLILGLGADINVESFLDIDFNVTANLDYNIMVFNLVNEVDDIIVELERQLGDDAGLAFPEWVKKKRPDFVKKVMEAHQSSGGS